MGKGGIEGGREALKLTDTGSRCTAAVKPAALEPLPEVYTAIGATCSFHMKCFGKWPVTISISQWNAW